MNAARDLTDLELAAELERARQLKVWARVTVLEAEARRRMPVELAHDAYYDGTAADRKAAR